MRMDQTGPFRNASMNKILLLLSLCLIPALTVQAASKAHRIGAGANYWVAVDDIDLDDVDEDGLSYLVSYQYRATLIGLQADVEFLPKLFGENAIAPAAYAVLGSAIYAAAGVGILNLDGEWADAPFFALKAGLDLEVLPGIFLDISGSYRFHSETDLDDALEAIDTDTVFLGAALRLGF